MYQDMAAEIADEVERLTKEKEEMTKELKRVTFDWNTAERYRKETMKELDKVREKKRGLERSREKELRRGKRRWRRPGGVGRIERKEGIGVVVTMSWTRK